jgi:extracellular elastinolytic metalloproteinase
MIGGLSGDIGGAIGEGASDVLAILINNNDVVGEYSTNNVNGIRSAPYANHPDTLASFNRARGVHRNGELFAATIWDVWELYQANALSVNTLLTDFVGGMNFTPSSPTYITMRDGLLAQTPASRDCLVWRAFASRGMGVGASISRTNFRVVQSFTVPSGC